MNNQALIRITWEHLESEAKVSSVASTGHGPNNIYPLFLKHDITFESTVLFYFILSFHSLHLNSFLTVHREISTYVLMTQMNKRILSLHWNPVKTYLGVNECLCALFSIFLLVGFNILGLVAISTWQMMWSDRGLLEVTTYRWFWRHVRVGRQWWDYC